MKHKTAGVLDTIRGETQWKEKKDVWWTTIWRETECDGKTIDVLCYYDLALAVSGTILSTSKIILQISHENSSLYSTSWMTSNSNKKS
jgi:hypothetical protein